jgi:hypothetical protein
MQQNGARGFGLSQTAFSISIRVSCADLMNALNIPNSVSNWNRSPLLSLLRYGDIERAAPLLFFITVKKAFPSLAKIDLYISTCQTLTFASALARSSFGYLAQTLYHYFTLNSMQQSATLQEPETNLLLARAANTT